MIRLQRLVRRQGKKFELRVRELEVSPGELIAVVGPNGAGKTTLLKVLAGHLRPHEGQLQHRFRAFDDPLGELLGPLGPLDDGVRYRKSVSFVPQSPFPFQGRLRGELELRCGEAGFRGDEIPRRAAWWLERLRLTEFGEHRHSALSDGYRMRAAICAELVMRPQVLLLDEPIGPLDVKATQTVLRDLRDIASSTEWPLPIVISSQHLHEVEAVADRLVFVRDGNVEFAGTPAQLVERSAGSVYEVRCSLDDDALGTLFVDLATIEPAHHTEPTLIRCKGRVASTDVLARLVDAGATVKEFRDLSGSTRLMFER